MQQVGSEWRMGTDPGLSDAWRAVVELAASSGQWQVSNLQGDGSAQSALALMLAVPVNTNAGQVAVATLVTAPDELLHALSAHADSSSPVILAITDGQGRILQRSVDGDKLVGKVVPDWPLLRQQAAQSGSITAQTLEGKQIIFPTIACKTHPAGWLW